MHRDDDHNLIESDLRATDDLVARSLNPADSVPDGLVDRVFEASVTHLGAARDAQPPLQLAGSDAAPLRPALPERSHSPKWLFAAMAAGVLLTIGVTMKFGFQSLFWNATPNPNELVINDAEAARLASLERELEAEFEESERLLMQMHGEVDSFDEESTLLQAALIESEITMTAQASDWWADTLSDGLTTDQTLLESNSFDSF